MYEARSSGERNESEGSGPCDEADLLARIDAVMVRDRKRLIGFHTRADTRLTDELIKAEERIAGRRLLLPTISYPEQLPISDRRNDILAALKSSQVVVLAGDTGSGKSTQLPKLLLESGRGIRGLIGHTQPRRLAARTIAERLAEELGTDVGGAVGYAVRFTDRVSERTLIKVMTDGILLAELQRDRDLAAYDAIIIDEAHERSLNIDFLLGYLHQLRARRPDLQIVITSATIDTQRFAEHFAVGGVAAPIIEVSGRTFPVEIRYQPFGEHPEAPDADDRDQTQAISDAVDQLCLEGPGDILVFLSGEREIRDTADALTGSSAGRYDILPLYARLSSADQHRIFANHSGRRVVLATNVAETSLTVPGIRYVIDAGTARISRYSRRLKVQRLPIEPISQASANQRSGRCGRVAPGVAIRLYGEEDFTSREAFTDPEILRTNLASVLLRMASVKLGDVEQFPFVEPPDRRSVKDGVALLEELGAFRVGDTDADKRLTGLGRKLAALPIDPRLGRMILEADKLGCVSEVLIIVSALSIQDPRERPTEASQQATELHKRFADEKSDFITWLNLWNHIKDMQKELGSSQFRKRCRAEFLNFLRIREWQDVHAQLRQSLNQVDVSMGQKGAHHDHIHQALLSGLLSQIGMKDSDVKEKKRGGKPDPKPNRRPIVEYTGARNAKFAIAPGSVLSRKGPAWVMAAELVETNRLWGRMAAGFEPEWAERLGGHLCLSSWSEPRFDARQGAAVITQRVTLFGLPIVTGRSVQLSRLDPPLARELFIRHGLAEGQWVAHHKFLSDLVEAKQSLALLAARARRSDIEVAEDRLEQLFSELLPVDVLSARTFEQWWKKIRPSQPHIFRFTPEQLQRQGVPVVAISDFPDTWVQGDIALPLSYIHDLRSDADGVTMHIPLHLLDRLRADEFDWHIPGLRLELLTALCRGLPKDLRKELGPAPDAAEAVLQRVVDQHGAAVGPIRDQLLEALTWLSGFETHASDLDFAPLPDYLRMRFSVEREDGSVVGVSRDLRSLQGGLRRRTSAAIGDIFADLLRSASLTWTFGAIDRSAQRLSEGVTVNGYPALADGGKPGVNVSVFSTQIQADRSHHASVRRLLLANLTLPMKQLLRAVGVTPQIALALDRHGSMSSVLDDCINAALDQLIGAQSISVRSEQAFSALREFVRDKIFDTAMGLATTAGKILHQVGSIEARLDTLTAPALTHAQHDIGIQVDRLVIPGFVALTGAARMPDLVRYLAAVEKRLDTLGTSPVRDKERTLTIQALERRYEDLLANIARDKITAEVGQIRWMLEELRIGLFAQQLGTKGAVSEKRILEAIASLSNAR
jgi:ATP-dependent helicase HrpA